MPNIYKTRRITDKELISRINKNIIKEINNDIKELKLKVDNLVSNDFIHKIYVYSHVEKNKSECDFKYEFIKEVLRRGAKFNIKTSMDLNIKKQNKIKKRLIKETIDKLDNEKLDEILNSQLITKEYADILKNDRKCGAELTVEEQNQLIKCTYYNSYKIDINANLNDVKIFLTDIAEFNNLNAKINNIKRFVFTNTDQINYSEIAESNANNIIIHKRLNKLLKLIGFKNGILSENIVNKLKNFELKDNMINELRILFRNNGDVGQFKANKNNLHKILLWLNRLCNSFYGINIDFAENLPYINGKRTRINENYQINLSKNVKEWFILKHPQLSDGLTIDKKECFDYSNIHGMTGTYQNYISKQTTQQCLFVDDNEKPESLTDKKVSQKSIDEYFSKI